jgi:hypothetical protein
VRHRLAAVVLFATYLLVPPPKLADDHFQVVQSILGFMSFGASGKIIAGFHAESVYRLTPFPTLAGR